MFNSAAQLYCSKQPTKMHHVPSILGPITLRSRIEGEVTADELLAEATRVVEGVSGWASKALAAMRDTIEGSIPKTWHDMKVTPAKQVDDRPCSPSTNNNDDGTGAVYPIAVEGIANSRAYAQFIEASDGSVHAVVEIRIGYSQCAYLEDRLAELNESVFRWAVNFYANGSPAEMITILDTPKGEGVALLIP